MAGTPKKRANRKRLRQTEELYNSYEPDRNGLSRAYREYALTGVLEDSWTGERYCPACERPEQYCHCGGQNASTPRN